MVADNKISSCDREICTKLRGCLVEGFCERLGAELLIIDRPQVEQCVVGSLGFVTMGTRKGSQLNAKWLTMGKLARFVEI